MSTVSDVIAFLETFAPPNLAEDWDNVGLLIGRQAASVETLMTCLTLTPDVAAEAIVNGAQMIVTHHPLMFRAIRKITNSTTEGELLLQLIESGIAVYSPHTCFDSASAGINRQLSEMFELKNIQPIRPSGSNPEEGSGRWGQLNELTRLEDFLLKVKVAIRAEYFEYCGSLDADVSRVAVACGAASDFLADAIRLGCDTFVTGEARFHAALEAKAAGLNLILLGHYSSERPAVESLAETIGKMFPAMRVFASVHETDPLEVFQS